MRRRLRGKVQDKLGNDCAVKCDKMLVSKFSRLR